jgi:hypothetical protein
VKENMFFILDIIISLTQIAGRRRGGIPSCGFNTNGVDTKSETSQTANDISRKVNGYNGYNGE